MRSTKGMTASFTRHALRQMEEKGFSEERARKTFDSPERVYASGSHKGQFRVTGDGICLVGRPEGKRFIIITVYVDGALTPPRPDQLLTPEGRRYAERYYKGLGRG